MNQENTTKGCQKCREPIEDDEEYRALFGYWYHEKCVPAPSIEVPLDGE